MHGILNNTLSYRGERFASTLNLPWPQRYLQYLSFFTEEEKSSIYADAVSFKRTDAWYAELTRPARERAGDLVHKALSMDIDAYLADDLLPKVDLGTMAHGLEARSPFLDHELLELTAQIPVEHKLHGNVGKWILKDLLKEDLPADILWRKKSGFRLPLDQWFRSDLKQFVHDQIMNAPAPFWEMFDRSKIEKFLHRYHDSRVDYSDHVWALLWLSEWMRRYTAL